MKKLMIAMAAAAFAVSAQAVAVNWDTYTVYAAGEDGNGWDADDNGVYDVVGATAAEKYTSTLILSTSQDLSNPVITQTLTGLSSDSNAYGTTAEVSTGVDYYGQVTVLSGDGKSKLMSEIFTFNIEDGWAKETYDIGISDGGDGIELASGADMDETYGAFQTTGWVTQSTPTPEPTTGLLMLVGLAGLALRRKVA